MDSLVVGESPCRIPIIIEIMKSASNYHFFCITWDVFAKALGVSDKNIDDLKKDLKAEIINMEGLISDVLYTWKTNNGDDAKLNVLCQAVTACHGENIADKLENRFAEILTSAANVHNKGLQEIPSFSHSGILHKIVEDTVRLTPSELNERVNLVLNIIKRNPDSINSVNHRKLTPLLINSIHVELIDLLVYSGSNIDAVNEQGCNFVHVAAKYLPSDQFQQLVKYLQGHGLIHLLNKVDVEQQTPLFHLIWNNSEANSSTIQIVAAAGVNFNAIDKYGATVLSDAVWRNQSVSILECLIECGANINWRSPSNSTLLHKAAWVRHVEALKYLVRLGLDVNSKDSKLCTPLMNAVKNAKTECNLEIVKFLLESGADVNLNDQNGNTALSLAVDHDRDVEVYKILVSYGADWNWKDEYNSNLLNVVSFNGNLQSIKYFVDLGLDVNSKDMYLFTPLMQCLLNSNVHKQKMMEIVKFLVEKNADIDASSQNGHTVLYLAKKYKLTDIYNFLEMKQKEKVQ